METRKDNDKRNTGCSKPQSLGQSTTRTTNPNVQDEDKDEGSKDDTGDDTTDTPSLQEDQRGKKSRRSLTASDDGVSTDRSNSAPNRTRPRLRTTRLRNPHRRVLSLLLEKMRKATQQLPSRGLNDKEEEYLSRTASEEDEDVSMESIPSASDLATFYASDLLRTAEAAVDESVDTMEDLVMNLPTQPEPEQASYMPEGYMQPSWFESRYRK